MEPSPLWPSTKTSKICCAPYTEPRYTKDIDIWVQPTLRNAQKVYRALKQFGAPLKNLSLRDLTNPAMVYQVGVEPNRVDILMGIGKLSFDQAWKNSRVSAYGRARVHILDRQDLILAKSEAGRPQDKLDLAILSESTRRRKR